MESAMEVEALPEAVGALSVSEQHSGPDRGPGGQAAPKQDEDCFYDCQESLQEEGTPGNRGSLAEKGIKDTDKKRRSSREDGEGERGEGDREEEAEVLGATCAAQEEEEGGEGRGGDGEGEKESWTECSEEGERVSGEGGKDDSDLELKAEEVAEFDDEYLRDLEKDLTEEERESRRDESMKLKETGNAQFKKGEHAESEASYTAALRVCPVYYSKERSILFSNRAAARLHLDKKEEAIADCSKAIELNPNYIRAILRRAELYEKTDKLDEALEDYKAVLEKDPSVQQAKAACMRLPQQIQERNEKLKEEMIGKLKDLGNMFLRPFGLSTSNFQVNQDPSSGSYSVNFVQNPNNNNR
ncbi:tetratricopeptide repeat protein 1 [Megalops cyprinoides]|uniref:tetratricopeptide repeat protein 1 n=1 Tax=Megalops cyprinoides TaxID=118141 RepID=UPI001864FE67|nr:tetratricopeptide repeat protein 1 [Megalops cyprinoides]